MLTAFALSFLLLATCAIADCNRDGICWYGDGDKVASWRCYNDKTMLVDIGDGGKILQVTHCDDCYFVVEQHKTSFWAKNYYRVKMFHNNGVIKDITSGRFMAKCYYHAYPYGVGGASSTTFQVNVGGNLKYAKDVYAAELAVGVSTTLTVLQHTFYATWSDGEVTNCGSLLCACSGPYRCYV